MATNQQYLDEIRAKATFEEISKVFYGQSYQNLSDVVKRVVCELATLCAEMEVYSFQNNYSSGAAGRDDYQNTAAMGAVEREKGSNLTSSSDKERDLDARVDGGVMATTTESDRGQNNGCTSSEKEREIDNGSTTKDSERVKDGSSLERGFDGGSVDSKRGKENGLPSSQAERDSDTTTTSTRTASEREIVVGKISTSSSGSAKVCSNLLDFIRCYGALLDSVRLKQQLLSSREWWERRECLAALSAAKEGSEACRVGELIKISKLCSKVTFLCVSFIYVK